MKSWPEQIRIIKLLQLSGNQTAHFGHVIIFTTYSVFHLFFPILSFAWAVRRRPSYGSREGGHPGLICGKGIRGINHLIEIKISTYLQNVTITQYLLVNTFVINCKEKHLRFGANSHEQIRMFFSKQLWLMELDLCKNFDYTNVSC